MDYEGARERQQCRLGSFSIAILLQSSPPTLPSPISQQDIQISRLVDSRQCHFGRIQCIGIHFKSGRAVGVAARRFQSERSRGGCEIVIYGGTTPWTKRRREFKGEMVGGERVRNSRATAFYDDGGFTRKSQCSATVPVACRNVHSRDLSRLQCPPISSGTLILSRA